MVQKDSETFYVPWYWSGGRIIKSFAMPRQTLVIFLCMERISGGSEKNLHLLLQHVEYFIFLKIEQKTSLVNLEAELCLFGEFLCQS